MKEENLEPRVWLAGQAMNSLIDAFDPKTDNYAAYLEGIPAASVRLADEILIELEG